MIIVEDVLTPLAFRYLKSVLDDGNFPWVYIDDVSGVSNLEEYADQINDPNKLKWGLSHSFVKRDLGVTDTIGWPTVACILNEALYKAGMDWANCYNARSFMSFPQEDIGDRSQISHIDMFEPHWVLLYYCTDHRDDPSADTLFFDEDLNIINRVSPKANSCVIFDGFQRHSGGIPTKTRRQVVNFNFEKAELNDS